MIHPMKAKWSAYQPFSADKSSAYTPFLVRAKNRPETRAQFNQFGQLLSVESGQLLGWTPEESADLPTDESPETVGKASGEPGAS